MPQSARPVAAPETLIELDFGDADFTVKRFPDGMYALSVNDERVLVTEEQFKQIVQRITELGVLRGWTLTFKGHPLPFRDFDPSKVEQ
jgi:hypothetical protein